jgi:threonine/homoserine/homoserine lactone efflux protein
MIGKGFRFGMMLQLAVGPICILIFNIGSSSGFFDAEMAVFAVTIVDASFILLAVFGFTSFISSERVKNKLKYFGALVLCLFGLNIILEAFNLGPLTNLFPIGNHNLNNPFLKGTVLTVSNPLTILFWVGVFSSKLAESNNSRNETYKFGLGAVLSTLFFLTFIAMLSSVVNSFIPENIIIILNILVGLALIYFGAKLGLKK